jgi:hypothetical protein
MPEQSLSQVSWLFPFFLFIGSMSQRENYPIRTQTPTPSQNSNAPIKDIDALNIKYREERRKKKKEELKKEKEIN